MKKSPGNLLDSEFLVHRFSFLSLLVLSSLPGISSSRVVTLGSIEIFNTHEWLPTRPTIYFKCQGGNKTVLPDVKKTHFLYVFKGEESWQPLTELPDKKCQRCGLYEADVMKPDDTFDEWEFCSSDFVDGRYLRFKEKEFNATFLCPDCTASAGSDQTFAPTKEPTSLNVITIVLISVLASMVAASLAYVAYKYWQKRKREQDQARFLKLFEEGDDIEDELGLEHL
ncbi:uncharacterized protein A4U43_C05F3890 [Asparagus officinalis]|uniref:DUF7953 domain-containing protein n=1 Tax=Asparagus officinalis TaxID=4686 RepID=A0A5P1EP53_ASPOF|nr:uncharacterized protein LOC109843760 [Asparagus officinalis]ONK67798.1 uncharacterized protein A4U43_C05F3890 [Asparagus officinalis]